VIARFLDRFPEFGIPVGVSSQAALFYGGIASFAILRIGRLAGERGNLAIDLPAGSW